MAAGLDFEWSGAALSSSLPSIPALRRPIHGIAPEIWGSEALSRRGGKVRCAKCSELGGQEVMSPEELQQALWKQFFADSRQWLDNRRSKPPSRHSNCSDEKSRAPLWLNKRPKPGWVNTQPVPMGTGLKRTSKAVSTTFQEPSTLAANEVHVEIGKCRKLCEDGRTSEAVDVLDILVQRRFYVPNNLFYRVLKGCIQVKDLDLGRRVHALTARSGYEGDAFLATHLIGLYASHGLLEEAKGVFTKVPTPNAYNWATIISAYARYGEAAEVAEAIRLYRQMCESTTVKPDDRLYSAVLKACAAAKDLVAGKEVHADILKSSGKADKFVQAGLVNMYAKCGSVDDARKIFDKLPNRDVVTWTSMIAGYARQGMGQEALKLHRCMKKEGLAPNWVTYACLLQACASVGVAAVHEGKQLHEEIKERGLQEDVVLGGSLVNMYAKFGSLSEARNLFDKLPERNIVAWNAMIGGYAQQGMGRVSLGLYSRMQQEGLTPPDAVTYVCLLQACSSEGAGALREGKQLHKEIEKRAFDVDSILGGSLVNMYAKCGYLEAARSVFDKIVNRSVVTWTAMIAGYAQQGMGLEALSLYRSMQQEGLNLPDCVTYVCLLQACAGVGVAAIHEGKQLHAEITYQGLQEDLVIGGSLVNMYAKCGGLEDALRLFGKLPERNIVAWNAMISGYAQAGMGEEALSLYSSMQREGLVPPDCVTYVCLLQACASVGVGALCEGQQLHERIKEAGLEEDVIVGGSLVNMHAKCGNLEDARAVFEKLPERNLVAWNAMIAGYSQQGMLKEALGLYSRMQQEGQSPDSVAYVCLLQACAAVAALPLGEQLHGEVEARGMRADGMLGAALVSMYAKCGSMYDSQRVFDSLSDKSIEAWGALISGYARQGDCQVVFDLVDRMSSEGVQQNDVTFLAVLTACSHAGLVDEGRYYFQVMRAEHGISATIEHYLCMVDLLGRAGHLEEALQMAQTMPFPATVVVWRTLLGACRKWKNVGIGQQAFNVAVSLDENDAASYVLMSNIYASSQMWDAAREVQARRKDLGAGKKPGESRWTDMGGVVHTFLVGDKKHPESAGIYARLAQLIPKMKKEGYVPHLGSSLLDIADDEKQAELCGHSEKLAIAYALNKTAEGTTIRIVKNLRVCEDCHTATAYISKVEKRIIICRDASRFHVFKEGSCSCGGYW